MNAAILTAHTTGALNDALSSGRPLKSWSNRSTVLFYSEVVVLSFTAPAPVFPLPFLIFMNTGKLGAK